MTPAPIGSHLFAAGNGVLVCRYPVGSDLPIPLGISAPTGVRLLTWAFTGFGAAGADPAGLLILHDPEGVLTEGGVLTLETHFRDDPLACPAPRPVADLTGPERTALGGAVLAAVTPDQLDALAVLFPLLAPAIAEAPVPEASPRLTLARDSDAQATLTGATVPNYLLVRAGTTWSCARVARAELRFGPAPEMTLALAPAWGRPRESAVHAALLLETGTVRPAALRAGSRR